MGVICRPGQIVEYYASVSVYVLSALMEILLLYTLIRLKCRSMLVSALIVMLMVTNICFAWW